jgi:hypothetical protein
VFDKPNLKIRYPDLGICGLSCRLCPHHHTDAVSRCDGCKTSSRMIAGCPFITCAVKKKSIEFCWDCEENSRCSKWAKHRESGRQYDSFITYQKLDENIETAQRKGVRELDRQQKEKQNLLVQILDEYNEGRSKSYYCIAVTLFDLEDLKIAIQEERRNRSMGSDIKARSKSLHTIFERLAKKKNLLLALRK